MTEREMLEVLLHNVETIGKFSKDKDTRNALEREVEVTKKRIEYFDELERGSLEFDSAIELMKREGSE